MCFSMMWQRMLDQGLEKSRKGLVHFPGEGEGEGLPNQEEKHHHQPHPFLREHKETEEENFADDERVSP